jgi:hypothetical protein
MSYWGEAWQTIRLTCFNILKIWMGQMGRLEEKIAALLFY